MRQLKELSHGVDAHFGWKGGRSRVRLVVGHVRSKSPKTISVSCWKTRCKTQVSAFSGYPSDAMLWIKEVEMVDSVDDF